MLSSCNLIGAQKTLVIIFDGVLHSNHSGWQGHDRVPDPPVDGALHFLAAAIMHFRVVIYSSDRSQIEAGRHAMRRYLLQNLATELGGLRGLQVYSQLVFPAQRPKAFLTLDDRVFCFTGIFPLIEDLLEFKPWNRPF